MTQNAELRRHKGKTSISQVATLEAELAEKQRQISELQEELSLVRSGAKATPKPAVAEEDVPAAPREAYEAAEALKHQVCFAPDVGLCTERVHKYFFWKTICVHWRMELISVTKNTCACIAHVKSITNAMHGHCIMVTRCVGAAEGLVYELLSALLQRSV